jgi:type IV pilus assembly protein PilN
MIKINLLSAKKEKKRGGLQREFVILLLSVVLLGGMMAVVHWRMGQTRSDLTEEIAKTEKDISKNKNLLSDLNSAKEMQRSLTEKLNVINTLRREKSTASRVMDEVSLTKPEKMHLESFKKDGLRVGMEGVALDNETVAAFMENMRKSKMFRSVDLVVSEQSEQGQIKLKKFTLSAEITAM